MDYRTAFITGASSGIGAALAMRLAARGVVVGLAARREDQLAELAAKIESTGGRTRIYPLDVSDPERTVEVIQKADDDLGGLDLVIANAGLGSGRWSGKLTYQDSKKVLDVNVNGAVATLTAVLPRMAKRKRGHLVGITSIAAYRGLPKRANYSGSKAFLRNFLESLRIDLKSTGVAVTEIRPGYIKTPMLDVFEKMPPFTIELEPAADKMMRAIDTRQGVCAFPWPVILAMRGMGVLPSGLYPWSMGR